MTARCRSCGCELQPWESDFCEGCGPVFLQAMKDNTMSKHHEIEDSYYIVRCVNSGVFFAKDIQRAGAEAVLGWSRMIHYWEGAAALSQVARDGIKYGRVCVAVEGREVLDICETIPCTEAAASNLLGQPEWVA